MKNRQRRRSEENDSLARCEVAPEGRQVWDTG